MKPLSQSPDSAGLRRGLGSNDSKVRVGARTTPNDYQLLPAPWSPPSGISSTRQAHKFGVSHKQQTAAKHLEFETISPYHLLLPHRPEALTKQGVLARQPYTAGLLRTQTPGFSWVCSSCKDSATAPESVEANSYVKKAWYGG